MHNKTKKQYQQNTHLLMTMSNQYQKWIKAREKAIRERSSTASASDKELMIKIIKTC